MHIKTWLKLFKIKTKHNLIKLAKKTCRNFRKKIKIKKKLCHRSKIWNSRITSIREPAITEKKIHISIATIFLFFLKKKTWKRAYCALGSSESANEDVYKTLQKKNFLSFFRFLFPFLRYSQRKGEKARERESCGFQRVYDIRRG